MVMGALASQELVRLTLKGDAVTTEERIGGFDRVRGVREGADGARYMLPESLGKLYRLTPIAFERALRQLSGPASRARHR